jgi:hypothetical protein
VFVLIFTEQVMMMYPAIDNPARCEICADMCFLRTKNMSVAEIYREVWTRGNEETVRQGAQRSEMGEQMKDVHDEKRNSWPAICSEFWPKNL